MALPKAIQRLEAEADAAVAALQNQQTQDMQGVVTDASQLPPANDAQAVPQSAASSTAPVSAPVTAPAVAPTPAPAPAPAAEDFEQRWRTLQGKYNAEVPRLTRALQEAQQQIAAMQQRFEQLTAKQTEEKQADSVKLAADPKDIEDFGADLVAMVHRQVERAASSLMQQFYKQVASFDSRVKAIEHQLSGVSARTESTLEQQFFATLTNLVPDWEKINSDERWLAWLAEADPVYGAPRQAALESAQRAFDAQRVANVFRAFKATLPQKPSDSLNTQVAPNGAAGQALVTPANKPVLSSQFIETFYKDVARGRYVGREQEAARIEAEINSAAAEGRIR